MKIPRRTLPPPPSPSLSDLPEILIIDLELLFSVMAYFQASKHHQTPSHRPFMQTENINGGGGLFIRLELF